MNRAARRLEERENKKDADKMSRLINKLTPDQMKLIDSLSSTKANDIAEKRVAEVSMLIDRNLSAALIILGLKIKQIEYIENILAELTEEDSLKYWELKQKCNEKEFEDKMEKIQVEIREAIEEMIERKITKKTSN